MLIYIFYWIPDGNLSQTKKYCCHKLYCSPLDKHECTCTVPVLLLLFQVKHYIHTFMHCVLKESPTTIMPVCKSMQEKQVNLLY
ncbi:hypothetical protein FKM82_002321 [Ascaphus truei]